MAFSSSNDSLWHEFLATWPIERLRTMTLPEYTTAGGKDSFVYWMESRLDQFGSMWGGSAFKFGIYSRTAGTVEQGDNMRAYDANYGWYRKLGDTPETAFAAVRSMVVRVAEAARDGQLEAIDDVELGDTYKWKIAFHYQSMVAPSIVCIFQRKPLLHALGLPLTDRQTPLSALNQRVGALRPSHESIVEYSQRLWTACARSTPFEVRLPEPAVRRGLIPFSLPAAPFPEEMHGGSAETEAGTRATFRTETGLTFQSDVRRTAPGKGVLRQPLLDYFKQIDAVPGTVLVISPESDGSFSIRRKGAASTIPPSVVSPVPPTPTPPVTSQTRQPLNQILFGPPGTGKTYHTIDRALAVLDPTFLEANASNRDALKQRFDQLTSSGHVQFVTFHQSFSYEEFVEGVRAETDDNGGLRYEVADGVFKRLCQSASAQVVRQDAAAVDPTGRRIWKLSLGDSTTERHIFDECVRNGYALLGAGASADFTNAATREDIRRTMALAGASHAITDYPVTAMNIFLHQVRPRDLLVITEGNLKFRAIGEVTGNYRRLERDGGDTYAQCRDVRWLRVYAQARPYEDLMSNRFSQMTLYELREGSIDLGKLRALLAGSSDTESTPDARVLIIDEINRGNVSRVFGELITLLEPSKRIGASEALTVALPYSKDTFGVPGNVHLIGTMNTADRSLAGVDIALRRRFQFVEMPPRPDLLRNTIIAGVNLGDLLEAMNRRIEALLDRDHQLGHAYFVHLESSASVSTLADVFRLQILPLLQEYFFEDWQRIAWVLNDHRKDAGARFLVQESTAAASLFGTGVEMPTDAKLWRIDESALQNPASYRGIISVQG